MIQTLGEKTQKHHQTKILNKFDYSIITLRFICIYRSEALFRVSVAGVICLMRH